MLKRSQIGAADQAVEGAQLLAATGHGNGASESEQLYGLRSWHIGRVCTPYSRAKPFPLIPTISNPVRAAYITSLESQISSLRDELATVYKTQGQNAQRLLSMTETLREKEELSRIESENLRKARDEIASLRRKVDQHNELMSEKDRTAQVRQMHMHDRYSCVHPSQNQILHDEINTLQLELGQIEERNQTLIKDNAKLLQRWLDAKQAEVNKMNEANEFYEDMKSRKQTVLDWRQDSSVPDDNADHHTSQGSGNASGNGEVKRTSDPTMKKDGIPSHGEKDLSLTPNG